MARGKKKTVIDTAHPHTIKKFELIEEYIKSWSQKLVLYENCNTLVFIDCMCNCGVYFDDDGNLIDGTSVRVANALLNWVSAGNTGMSISRRMHLRQWQNC